MSREQRIVWGHDMEYFHAYCCLNDIKGAEKEIASEGFNINDTDCLGNTPLHIAAWWGNLEIAKRLVEAGCDINAINASGYTAYTLAMKNDQQPMGEYLKNKEEGACYE